MWFCRASELACFAAVSYSFVAPCVLDIVLLYELNVVVFSFFGSVSCNLNTVCIFSVIVGFLS